MFKILGNFVRTWYKICCNFRPLNLNHQAMKKFDLTKLIKSAVLAVFVFFSVQGNATTDIVTVSNFQFSPASLNVLVGDTIKWNWSSGSHTTTSTSVPSGVAAWDSPMNSNSTTFSYTVTTVGVYSYKCGFHPSMTASFTASTASLTPDVYKESKKVLFYPNPATDFLTVELGASKTKSVSVVLSDILGNPVYSFNTENNSQQAVRKRIDIRDFPSGIYFLSVVDDFSRLTYKILKNNN